MEIIQKKIKKFCEENDMESPIEHRVLDLVSEVGEVAKEILIMSNYGKQPITYRKEIENEVGDVFYSLITVANSLNIDLNYALSVVLKKYKTRLKKGSAGSENE